MLVPNPSLSSYEVKIYRKTQGVDSEGTPLQTYTLVDEFRGGFGSVATGRELVEGYAGQRVDAAISTEHEPNALIGDKVNVSGRDWALVGISDTPVTYRLLLAQWGGE